MIELNGAVTVKCNACGQTCKCDVDYTDSQITAYNHEDGMGLEYLYDYEGVSICSHCGEQLNITFELQEYPIGAVQFISDSSEKCRLLEEPLYTITTD